MLIAKLGNDALEELQLMIKFADPQRELSIGEDLGLSAPPVQGTKPDFAPTAEAALEIRRPIGPKDMREVMLIKPTFASKILGSSFELSNFLLRIFETFQDMRDRHADVRDRHINPLLEGSLHDASNLKFR
jgi:hypothetical protein